MGGYAWVTLATNNSYSLGALVLAHSLKKSNTAHKLVVLITSSVSESMRNQLNTVFDVVKLVDVLDSKDEAHLALMQRPELGITFTKIHCWRLIEFEKCVFLDADTLVVRNCDELFEREEFSAAPDASWPDCFNSGVFVFRPSIETFNKILQFAVENKSFDGGDQGLLNQFFSSWATEDIKKHLPFVYNLTSIGSYAYIPAFKHYGSETRIVHFIGTGKPWLQQLDIATKTVKPSSGYEHLAPLLQQWWDLFCEKVHPNLDKNLESSNEEMSHSPVEACSNSLPIALTDESKMLRLIPCTPHEEKVVTEHNLPFKINDSSGESPKPFIFVSETKRVGSELNRTENVYRAHQTPEKIEGPKECTTVHNRVDERDKEEKKEQQPQEEPPPKDPFDYESFFPDESCIKNYLEQNVETYQPFEHQEEVKIHKEPEPLPRFLTIPEDDQRQSGNVDPPVEKHEPQKQPTPEKETRNIAKVDTPPRETLTKSKSMPFLPLEVTPEPPKPLRSMWKSQPNVNVDPNKKYSMPKLKPILPRQSSKYVLTKIPKITQYTEFLMSSEYKDPVNLPKDRIGFVATQLHTQRQKRTKANVRTKFGPLPFIPSPEKEKPACKKIRLDHSDDDLYDLTQCKRQSGNKPKAKDVQKKQNGNNVEEILRRLKEFSKDYQHYFGMMPKPRKRTIMCKNAMVQASGEGECRTSEAFKTVRTAVCSWSRGTQTSSQRDEFFSFRNYVKNQNEASQKGLLMISGRRSSNDFKINLGIKNQKREENTQNDDVIISNRIINCDQSKTAQSARVESISFRHSGEEEKTVVHSKKQSGLVIEEKQQNSENDVTVFKSGIGSLKLQKSEINKDCGGIESSKVVHPENHPRLTDQHDGDVTKAQTNIVLTEQQKSHEVSPVVQKESVKSQSGLHLPDDVKTPQNNGVLLSFQETVKLKKNNVDIEPSKVQSTYLENKKLENHSRLTVEESDDVTTQKNGVSFDKNDKSPKIPSSRDKKLAPSVTQSSLIIEESQQNDDVIKAVKVPLEESQRVINEEEFVVQPKKQSPLDVKERQIVDDVTKNNNSLNVQLSGLRIDGDSVESSTVKQTDSVDDVTNGFDKLESSKVVNSEKTQHSVERNNDVITPQNESVADKSEEFRTGSLENGSQPDSSLENGTIPEQNQTPRGDDVTNSFSSARSNQFTSSPVVVPNVQNGNESQQIQNDEKIKKPEEILCVPDFETPRSSRVTVKTTEEEIKPRKSRSSPKKVHGRYTKNSPDESDQFTGKRSGKEEIVEEAKDTSGIAGAIAQLSLQAGSEQTPESTAASAAHQEYLRRQNWETGNIDYMGRDSFDNIWSKICQTLEAKDQESPTTGGEAKKPSETLPNVPEFIETLPGKPAPGPVEDDEIIFSKPDSRQSGLTNISEEEEAGGEGVKLSDILGAGKAKAGDVKPPVTGVSEGKIEPLVQSSDVKPQVIPASASEVKAQPQTGATEVKAETKIEPLVPQEPVGVQTKPEIATEIKAQVPTAPVDVKPEIPVVSEGKVQLPAPVPDVKPQPAASAIQSQPTDMKCQPPTTEIKTQAQVGPVEVKPELPVVPDVKPQPTAPETQPQPTEMKTQFPVAPQPNASDLTVKLATDEKQPTTGECKVVAIPSPPILPPSTLPKTKQQQQQQLERPQVQLEPIPLPPPDSPSSELPVKTSDTTKDDGKQKKGVFTKILEMVGVKEKNGSEESKSVFYDVEGSGESGVKEVGKEAESKQPEVAKQGESKQPEVAKSSESKQPEVAKPAESKQPEVAKPDESKQPEVAKPAESKQPEVAKQTEGKQPEVAKQAEGKQPEVAKQAEGKQPEVAKPAESTQPEVAKQQEIAKQAESKQPEVTKQPEKSTKDSQQTIQTSETIRKSPSPKLTMPQTPGTAITTPTPPPSQEIPPMKNPALLKVDETILETPPVPEPSNIQTEIEDIIGKAKTEVENLIEKGTSDVVNTMKLIMGEEQEQEQKEGEEEVEELKVTTEEERKRHKGEVVTSKLSDQILKAIPPPRRKAISEATASTSAIPKATTDSKNSQPTDGKQKSTKPSSIPVPPPRNKGKPQPPPPSKGKGKK